MRISPPVIAAAPGEADHLQVVRPNRELASVQARDARDSQGVGADALNAGAQVQSGSGTSPGRAARRPHCGSRSCRWAVAAAMTMFSLAVTLASSSRTSAPLSPLALILEYAIVVDAGAHLLERQHVSVQAAAADDVAARGRQPQAASTCDDRPGQQDRGANAAAEVGVQVARLHLRWQ